MELNVEHSHQTEEQDRISMLGDDILHAILGKVNLSAAVRASILSRRWRRLPWSLPQLNIDANDFFQLRYFDPEAVAMESLTKAVTSFLASDHSNIVITRLRISVFLISTSSYWRYIGPLLSEAIANGKLKQLELASGIARYRGDNRHAACVRNFFSAYPSVSFRLTRLAIYHADFTALDLGHLIVSTCKQLRQLHLFSCDVDNGRPVFKMNAPDSKLTLLELDGCWFKQLELVCLPKLERLLYGFRCSKHAPLSLRYVPRLKQVDLFCSMGWVDFEQRPFKLSTLLCGSTSIDTLTLDFVGKKICLQPEGNRNQIFSVSCKLRKLSIHGVFVGFGLLWTTALLEAAPSLEILDVEVWDHLCDGDEERNNMLLETVNVPWKVHAYTGSKHSALKQLQLHGFDTRESYMAFVGAVMKQAPHLEAVELKEKYCKKCDEINTPSSSGECRFPKNVDEQEVVLNHLRERSSSCAQIVFSAHTFSEIRNRRRLDPRFSNFWSDLPRCP